MSPTCVAALFVLRSPWLALHCGVCPPTRQTHPSANVCAGHRPCQGAGSAALQSPLPATRLQSTAASVRDDAYASRAPSLQFSTTPHDLPVSTPALAASYRSTPVFMMVYIILRNNFPQSAYWPQKNNAADRPSPADHRPQGVMQRVLKMTALKMIPIKIKHLRAFTSG